MSTTVLTITLLAGCAAKTVRIDPPDWPAPLVQPVQLRVGVYIDSAQRNYSAFAGLWTSDDIRLEVGAAGTTTLMAAARGGFAEAVELAAPAATDADRVDVVLTISALEWRIDLAKLQPLATAKYGLRLSETSGAVIGDWTTTQRVDYEETLPDPGTKARFSIAEIYGVPLLLEKVAAAFLREFREAPAIRSWLEARGAYRPALPPFDAGLAPSAESPPTVQPPPGIFVESDVASNDVRSCVIKEVHAELPARPLVSGRLGRRALFPWLSDRPPIAVAADRVVALAQYGPAKARLQALGVGAVILVSGGTEQHWHGAGACGAGFGGGGCLGLLWGKRDSLIAARLIELSRPHEPAERQAHKSSTAVVPMFILPLPFIPATESAACHELSKALVQQLRAP